MVEKLKDPWLIAAWPGMGGVALIAGTYLAQQLGADRAAEVPSGPYFDVEKVRVEGGLAQAAALPTSTFFAWRDPAGRRDLLIFLGEAQPAHSGYRFCEEILATAREFGVKRLFTFAAMATPMAPQAKPRVFAVANERALLTEVLRRDVEALTEGEISGLNGVLLAAASAQELPGACLLGEFPYFASGVPNPKASSAVLRAFSDLSGVRLDFGRIDAQAEAVERSLVELLEEMQRKASTGAAPGSLEFAVTFEPSDEAEQAVEAEEPAEEDASHGLDREAQRRIEALFAQAEADRSRALDLKAELDRHGAFKAYEDRFLDLFTRGE